MGLCERKPAPLIFGSQRDEVGLGVITKEMDTNFFFLRYDSMINVEMEDVSIGIQVEKPKDAVERCSSAPPPCSSG